MTEEPLPGMPDDPPPKVVKARTGETFSRYSVKARRLCDVCVWMIHQYGQGGAPYPRSAKWRRATPEANAYVCEQHKETRL